jgi:hypothetical protein
MGPKPIGQVAPVRVQLPCHVPNCLFRIVKIKYYINKWLIIFYIFQHLIVIYLDIENKTFYFISQLNGDVAFMPVGNIFRVKNVYKLISKRAWSKSYSKITIKYLVRLFLLCLCLYSQDLNWWHKLFSQTCILPLCQKNVILGILGQIIKAVKWPRLPLFICHIKCELIVACLHAHAHAHMPN